ncbi:PREDICTED: serine/threonine-protein kinase grp isoform X2 [Nicrophorus vespilloides]|uniref:non-specific serine/threonine protein kinase n=1 Tax=Nicrophorus vespilloides TaxID=110193 RepID=A0ABM1NJ32_NICVS|nr:PREDICTED: serine/threonine-protein kinase grp isoform X2 [Nicrophorus vespilloides]
MDKFVDEWLIIQTLGEGAYGEVKLLVHQVSGEAVAMKVVDLRKCKDAKECVTKEEKIHKLMMHPNIIRILGKREEPNTIYIFLEYASGGELFNKIEPDIGMYAGDAQKYMKQLLNGMEYLHSKGITHRDIKPENLLLDEHGNLKISDFGMATIFRLRGKQRLLDKKCGTLSYVAPEVLKQPYYAEPADLWSCGIVFVAMLAGELPWDEPTQECREYSQWMKDTCITQTPWSKLTNVAFSLARKMLTHEPKARPTLSQILQHPWMNIKFPDSDYEGSHETPTVTSSQPAPRIANNIAPERLAILMQNREQVCFSQPTSNDDLIVNSQLHFTQSPLTQNNFQKLIKRMTRFFVKTSCEKTTMQLCKVLDQLCYNWNSDPSGVITISLMDAKRMQLVFKANILEMDGKMLVDFRLSKGCGLEFKRNFMKIKKSLQDIIC